MRGGRGFHQHTPSRQRGSEHETHSSYGYGSFSTPAAAAARGGGGGGGSYAANYYSAHSAWADAAGGRMPQDIQHPFLPNNTYQGIASFPYRSLDVTGSVPMYHTPYPEDGRRRNESPDESELEYSMSELRNLKAGPRERATHAKGKKEGKKLKSSMHSEVASVPTELPPANLEVLKNKAERAAKAAYERLLREKRGVTVWKVVQEMLITMELESLDSVGISIHDIPSLRKLVTIEEKINTYIHCHVVVRRITTLDELSLEITQNEGISNFEDLKLGPLSFNPLVGQYFAFPEGLDIHRISTEDVLSHMSDYMKKHPGNVEMDDFLAFITKARSVPSPQHLGIRLRNIGMYVSFIRREMKAEKALASHRANLVAIKESSSRAEKPGLSITTRIDAFLAAAAAENAQCPSVSSDDEDSTRTTRKEALIGIKNGNSSGQFHPTSCPYPSAAEERVRVCAKSSADTGVGLLKTEYDLSKQELGDFVAAWRGFCQKNSVSDVLMHMLSTSLPDPRKGMKKMKRKLARFFKQYPAIGILNIAVLSMKAGHWNSLYDAFEEAFHSDVNNAKGASAIESVDRIEIVPEEPQPSMLDEKDNMLMSASALHEILLMLEKTYEVRSAGSDPCMEITSEKQDFGFMLKKLMECEKTLLEQLLPEKLNSNFRGSLSFVDLYIDKVSNILLNVQMKNADNQLCYILPEHRIKNFLYQLSVAIKNFDRLPQHMISQLLAEQFHLGGFHQYLLDLVKRYVEVLQGMKSPSFTLFYSHALLGTNFGRWSINLNEVSLEIEDAARLNSTTRVGLLGNLTSMDAKNCLVKAPMFCNIAEWSHWDIVFAPVLGPLQDWLEMEKSPRELVCLVTNNGSILRIDGTASVDSLLAAAIKGLGKETALQLISLLAIYGGADKVPRALLKSYLSKALESMVEKASIADRKRKKHSFIHDNAPATKRAKGLWSDNGGTVCRVTYGSVNPGMDASMEKYACALEFVLEFFVSLPSEFLMFASSIVLPVLCSIIPDAAAAMLNICSSYEQMTRLHEVGLCLGIPEWIKDFQMLLVESNRPVHDDLALIKSKDVKDKVNTFSSPGIILGDASDNLSKTEFLTTAVSLPSGIRSAEKLGSEKHINSMPASNLEHNKDDELYDATEVISHIRREEFGMDMELSGKELDLLTRQHARIGRALQCLSRELYSQDSHFVLELVQNADDNHYGANVYPMLVFMLQQERVVVVNNELGFTPANMKALCDVGSSTKIGSAAGYIGQKGIGFKSVFRVTDSPQIHSKGFHVKFDISEGSLGFILPTLIPSLNDWPEIEEVLAIIESSANHGKQTWNTCMVLPLKDSITKGPEIELLSTKFCDIHSSLLLFLRQLCCITIKDDVRGVTRVMQRYILGDGLVKVSDNELISNWLVIKQQLDALVDRPKVEKTEIALAFPLCEISPGEFEACKEQQQVFAFLPLRSYGLRFIVQGDFVLPSSREDLDTDSPWNQWLLSEIPSVCVKALEAFKELPCFKGHPGKAASVFMSFLPFEGEVQGFFSSLPRMIFASLRASSCLPIEDRDGEWAFPCTLLAGWNDSVKKLLHEELLWELLGLRYLHKQVLLPPVVVTELGIQMYGSRLLMDFLESLCTREDTLQRMGPKWISLWLVALHTSLITESQRQTCSVQFDLMNQELKRLRALHFIPLSNGTYTSLEDGPLWLPSHDASSETGRSDILTHFPLLYSELRTVNPLLLCPEDIESCEFDAAEDSTLAAAAEERGHLYSILRQLGIRQISEHKVLTLHVLPSMSIEKMQDKSDSLFMQCLAFVMVHLQSECKDCRKEGQEILTNLKKNAVIITNQGRKNVKEVPLHFGVKFGCPVDVKKLLEGLQVPWTEVDSAYIQTYPEWPEEVACLKWRSFFKELGVTDFVKLVPVERKIQDKATSMWKDIPWLDHEHIGGTITVEDWECPEAIQILESMCKQNDDLSKRRLHCSQFLSFLDIMWEENYAGYEATYGRQLLSDSQPKQTTLPSWVLCLRSFPWVESSFDGKFYHPTDLFYQCPAVESILGKNAPYARPQVKSMGLVVALGLQTVVSVSSMLHVLKLWNHSQIHMSIEEMRRVYAYIWSEMCENKDIEQFLQTERAIFIPETTQPKPVGPVQGKFEFSKNVVWKDETGCVLLIASISTRYNDWVLFRTLDTLYPTLQSFFTNHCLVQDTMSFREYYGTLRIIAEAYAPSKVLSKVLKVLAMWSNNIKSSLVSMKDVSDWKGLLQKDESKVLPTVKDKWVSLNSGEGVVCWCDDQALGQMFSSSKDVHYICTDVFSLNACSERSVEGINAQLLGPFLEAMSIPPLSKVVEREPIAYGAQRNKQLMDLLNWTVPYVQRYIQKMCPDVYKRLRQSSVTESLSRFTCVICEQLFFRYKLQGSSCSSSERLDCSYLLEGNILYATSLDDLNSLYLEFSKLFFDGVANVQLANFLHLITLSVQSGSSEAEVEALLSAQGISARVSNDEKWVFHYSDVESIPNPLETNLDTAAAAPPPLRRAKKFFAKSWPPPSLQHGASSANRSSHPERLAACQKSLDAIMQEIEVKKARKRKAFSPESHSRESPVTDEQDDTYDDVKRALGEDHLIVSLPDHNLPNPEFFSHRDQLAMGVPNEQQQELTGRLGEAVVYNHLLEKYGPEIVEWMNAEAESGLPYDIVIRETDGRQKMVEVKTTWSEDKDWFEMSPHEWELACRLGDRFIIVRVFLAGGSSARFLWLPDPHKLSCQRLIKLALVLPRQGNSQTYTY